MDQEEEEFFRQQKRRQKERIVQELARWEFPQRISSYRQFSVPTLEFSKMLCNHVFGLDESFFVTTGVLFKNMLRIIHQKEFAPEVRTGIEPSLILILPDVICASCQDLFDLDICRNNMVTEESEVWPCKQCKEPLDKDLIERRLIEILNRRVLAYQMQDLKCQACKMVSNTLVIKRCECTGKLMQTEGYESPEQLMNQNLLNKMTDIRLFLELMRNFGSMHQMIMLAHSAEMMLATMPEQTPTASFVK